MHILSANVELFGLDLELVSLKHDDGYEIWVYDKKEILNHYFSTIDPREKLILAEKGDVTWEKVEILPTIIDLNLPRPKIKAHVNCFEFFWERKVDRKSWNKAKKNIIGTWGDGSVLFVLRENEELEFLTDIPKSHILHGISSSKPDWWDFKSWTLSLGSTELGGMRYPVYNCNSDKLLIKNDSREVLAHVFKKTEQS